MLELIGALAFIASAQEEIVVEKEKDPVICKGNRSSAMIGSNIRRKECRKKSEWDHFEKQTQRDFQKMRDRHVSPGRAEGR